MKKYLGILSVLLLSGCMAFGPSFKEAPKPQTDNPVIYFYRDSAFVGAGVSTKIYLDDVKVIGLGMKGFTWIQVPEGEHTIKAYQGLFEHESQKLEIKNYYRNGERKYYKLGVEDNSALNLRTLFMRGIPENSAIQELQDYSYQSNNYNNSEKQ